MGKKFSRRIWQDAVGTCRRIICWRETAARYFGAEMQRRDDLKKGLPFRGCAQIASPNANNSLNYSDSSAYRSVPNLASQCRLGYYPASGLGLILLIVLILILAAVI